MEGVTETRFYERGKTRLRNSSWVLSTHEDDQCCVAGAASASAQLHVLNADDGGGECSAGECECSPQVMVPDGTAGCVDDDGCDGLSQGTVVRGGISVPLPLHCDLNEIPEVMIDEYLVSDLRVSATPLLGCDLNEIPEVVAEEVVSDHVVSKRLPFMPICSIEVEKGEIVDGISDETATKEVNSDNANKYDLRTDCGLQELSNVAEQEHNGRGNKLNLQTPQQKVRRKKHRPKVLVDGYKPRVPKKKSMSPLRKLKGHLTNKKKSLSEIVPNATEQIASQSTRKSTRRILDFDSKGYAADYWYPSDQDDVNHFYIYGEARGEKRGYSRMISNSDVHDVEEYNTHLPCAGNQISTPCDNLPHVHFLEISKRRRTTKGKSSPSSIECWISRAKFLSEPGITHGCLEEIQRTKCPTPQAKRSKGFVRIRRLSFSSSVFKFFKRKYKAVRDLITGVRVPRKKRSSKRLSKGKAWSNIIRIEQLYHSKLIPYNHQRFSFKSRASAQEDDAWEVYVSVDEIMERLQDLNINRENSVNYRRSTLLSRYSSRFRDKDAYLSSFDMKNGEEYALVPYKRDGTLVPFIKKKLPRPRVDLDAETNRVWNLLLENINDPGIDGSDEATARQWNAERNVFRERANLFIARMHLIQGDRRFSPWKGSVLDSVIGVFLTQNVSDHLSSSAFMSLAAKFPPKLQCNGELRHDTGAGISNDRFESSVTNSRKNYAFFSLPEDEFEYPVNSALALENFEIQRPSDGELGRSEITTEDAMIIMDETISTIEVNISSQSSSDSFTQTFARAGLTFNEIPAVNQEFDTKYPNTNYLEEVLEFSVSGEGCNSLTSGIAEEMDRELEAALSDVKSQTGDDLLSLSRVLEVFETPLNEQLHLTSDLGSENLECMLNIEKGNTILEGSFRQSREDTTHLVDFTEHAHVGSLACQGSCTRSDVGSCPCLMSVTSHNVEFPAIKGSGDHTAADDKASRKKEAEAHKAKTRRVGRNIDHTYDWDSLRKRAQENNKGENLANSVDSIDYEALRSADVSEIAKVIKKRGMNAMLAERIQDFLNGLVAKHGSTNLEWLRDVLPDQAKEYLLTVRGLGLKSVECVRLLTLHQLAFPVDTNVGRIAVRLGWVPLQPLPESLQLHLLEQYPVLESIQKHLWPRLCKLDQKTLYELHYQMITFGKVFCTKTKPNCNSCPMRGDCRHFASEFASSRLALPSSKDKLAVLGISGKREEASPLTHGKEFPNLLQWFSSQREVHSQLDTIHPIREAPCEPIIEVPASPEPMYEQILDRDIEDIGIIDTSDCEDTDEIPTIRLNIAEFAQNLQNYVHENMEVQEAELSKALVALTSEAASIPPRKLKNASGLRTEHQVYVLPDSHPLLEKFDKREPDDPSPYLLAIWTPGETAKSIQLPESKCNQEHGKLCNEETCLLCSSVRESEDQIVRGTILIPCRTAMRGSFPLNGTYFQVNEVFADFHSSHNPIEVPRNLIWNLQTRTVYFGTSVPTIFRGMVTERIQQCFWKGYICVRGFDKETRAPRPLAPRLHLAKSLLPKPKSSAKDAKKPRNTANGKQFKGSRH